MAPLTPRVILVDGFAGTGKSTMAQRLWLHLIGRSRRATWFHEHETGHPVFEYGEVEELLQQTPDAFETRVLTGWRTVVAETAPAATRIIEGSFFQIPVGVMLAMNAPVARIRALVRRIDAVLAATDTALVYLQRPDQRKALERVGHIRGPQWLAAMTAAVGQSAYGQTHRVRDLTGLTKFYQRQSTLIDAIWPVLRMRRIAVDVSADMWPRHERSITSFLGIRPAPRARADAADLLRHAGSYVTPAGRTGTITTDGESLYLQVPATNAQRLIRVSPGAYCVESLPIDVRFDYDRAGRARRVHYESRMVNEVLPDRLWIRS